MAPFWILLVTSAILIVVGLFIFTQGGESLGTAVVTIGVMMIVFMIMSSAKAHDHARPMASANAISDRLKAIDEKVPDASA